MYTHRCRYMICAYTYECMNYDVMWLINNRTKLKLSLFKEVIYTVGKA